MKISVVGSANWDLYVEAARLPEVGETLNATGGGQIRCGGKGANTAAACAKLGAHTTFIGQLGDDWPGKFLKDTLTKYNVDISKVATLQDQPTGQATVILLENSDNSIIIVGGANMAWQGLSEEQSQAITASQGLLLQREVPDEINLEAVKVAHNAGKLVIMDLGGRDTPLPPDILPFIDILSPNETELARLTGLQDFEESIATVQALGVKHLLIKLGSKGSLYVGEHGRYQQQVRNKEGMQIVDTTGAGDCFTGAFGVRLLEQGEVTLETLKEAMDFGSMAAFLTITKKGAMEASPMREEVNSF